MNEHINTTTQDRPTEKKKTDQQVTDDSLIVCFVLFSDISP